MNDDFLHQMREAPRPEFLARLKGRLDRRPVAAQPRQSSSFVRGLITGLLLAGAGLAIAAFLAGVLPGGSQRSSDQTKSQDHHGAVPLGPAWFPTHPGTQPVETPPPPATQQASATTSSGSAAAQGAPAVVSETLTVAATTTTFTLAQLAAGRYKAPNARARVELSGNPFDRLCAGQPYGSPEVIEVVQRMPASYSRYCANNGLRDIIEVKLGYQAIVLVRAKQSGALKLSSRDLFLALARQIPDPNQPGHLINNPNITWDQVDPALPSTRIQVIGPGRGMVAGQLVLELVLDAGCNALPRTAGLREADPWRYEELCRNMRDDGVYQSSFLGGGLLVDYFVDNPTVIGVLTLEQLARFQDKLQAVPVDSIEATAMNIANGTYPLSRGLYIYGVKRRVLGSPTLSAIVRYNMDAKSLLGNDSNGWGFVPLDADERTAILTNVDAQH
jgi:phosphate transport system substrate-binding protein